MADTKPPPSAAEGGMSARSPIAEASTAAPASPAEVNPTQDVTADSGAVPFPTTVDLSENGAPATPAAKPVPETKLRNPAARAPTLSEERLCVAQTAFKANLPDGCLKCEPVDDYEGQIMLDHS